MYQNRIVGGVLARVGSLLGKISGQRKEAGLGLCGGISGDLKHLVWGGRSIEDKGKGTSLGKKTEMVP